MRTFVKAVVTGFAFSLGAAVFKKLAPKLGLGEPPKDDARAVGASDAADARVDGVERSTDPLPS
jgi:hypothetical protein